MRSVKTFLMGVLNFPLSAREWMNSIICRIMMLKLVKSSSKKINWIRFMWKYNYVLHRNKIYQLIGLLCNDNEHMLISSFSLILEFFVSLIPHPLKSIDNDGTAATLSANILNHRLWHYHSRDSYGCNLTSEGEKKSWIKMRGVLEAKGWAQ